MPRLTKGRRMYQSTLSYPERDLRGGRRSAWCYVRLIEELRVKLQKRLRNLTPPTNIHGLVPPQRSKPSCRKGCCSA
ncbi:hypothetical protein VN97_g9868 [Penicillium thymicola]|uniref:Uncharacterized protein n=1 Tax=Penicillium thymicola TaxID=293382 RepID=A0AAI9TAP7_PENTH|nr:hypothetical protein VN97_g9868 [Penicillium thymicola]